MNNLETAVILGLSLLSIYSYIRLLFFKKSRYYKDTSVADDTVENMTYPSGVALGPIGAFKMAILQNIWGFIWQQVLNIVEAIFLFDRFYVKEGQSYRIVFLSTFLILVIFLAL